MIETVLKVSEGALQNAPVFSSERRRKNWAAILYPDKTKYKVGRIFLDHAKRGIYNISTVRTEDILEFGSDLLVLKMTGFGPRWTKEKDRWVGRVTKMSDDEMWLMKIEVKGDGYDQIFIGL